MYFYLWSPYTFLSYDMKKLSRCTKFSRECPFFRHVSVGYFDVHTSMNVEFYRYFLIPYTVTRIQFPSHAWQLQAMFSRAIGNGYQLEKSGPFFQAITAGCHALGHGHH